MGELGFRVVEVEDVDRPCAEVGEAGFELVLEKGRGHGVLVGGDFERAGIGGGQRAGDEVAGLGGDDEFLAAEGAEDLADGAFRALGAVVERGVDEVDAAAQGGIEGFGVVAVGGIIGRAEVGADAERGDGEAGGFAEEAVGPVLGEAGRVFGGGHHIM